MPNIRQYTAPPIDTELRPNELGPESAQRAAYRVGAMFDEAGRAVEGGIRQVGVGAGDIEKHLAQNEISQGMPALIKLTDTLHQRWEQTAKGINPNDGAAGGQFEENISSPAYQKFVQSFDTEQGRQWATRAVAQQQQHLHETVIGDLATMAGDAVVANTAAYANNVSSAVYRNPASLDSTLAGIDPALDALTKNSPNLTAAEATKVKTELSQKISTAAVTAAFKGLADKSPDAAEAFMNNPKYSKFLNVPQAAGYLRTIRRVNEAEARANFYQQQEERRAASDEALSGIIAKGTYGPNGALILPADDVKAALQNPSLDSSAKMTVLRLQQHQNDIAAGVPKTETDPAVWADFQSAVAKQNPSDPSTLVRPEAVMQAVAIGKLSMAAGRQIIEEARFGAKDPAFASANAQFNKWVVSEKAGFYSYQDQLLGKNNVGETKFYQYSLLKRQEFINGLQRGLTPAQMLTRTSPDYIGGDETKYGSNTNSKTLAVTDSLSAILGNGEGTPTAPAAGSGTPAAPAAPADDKKAIIEYLQSQGVITP